MSGVQMSRRGFRQRPVRSSAFAAASVIVLLGLSACGSAPNAARMAQAEAAVDGLRSAPQVMQNAPVAVREAEQSLATARQAAAEGEGELANHHAFMAVRGADLAQAQAAERLAQQRREAMAGQTTQLRLSSAQARADRLAQQLAARDTRQEGNSVVATYDLPFATDSATFRSGAAARLSPLVGYLRDNPRERVEIHGHTDATGPADYNERLSQARADAVRDHLIAQGIAAERIRALGMGEGVPIAGNDTDTGRAANRRVEVQLTEVPQ